MCRLLLAKGDFAVADVLAAAVDMACGRTAAHEGPIREHPNGWGAVWSTPDGLAAHRDVRPIGESFLDSPLTGLSTGFLAIHSRHATLAVNHGLRFTHPLERPGSTPWFFMHNGFLPSVHRNLGMPASLFDSLEYFDYVVPAGATALEETGTLARLAEITPEGSSGNAFAINPRAAYVIHWTPAHVTLPLYFGMSIAETPGRTIVSSEVIPQLADGRHWRPLPPDHVLEIPLTVADDGAVSGRGELHHVNS